MTSRFVFAAFSLAVTACGGSSAVCTAGQQIGCPCPGGASGAQACADDGSRYLACVCPGLPGDGGLALDVPLTDAMRADGALADGATEAAVDAGARAIVHVNWCQPSGCAVRIGPDDATQFVSSIPMRASTVAAFSGSTGTQSAIVACLRTIFAPFNVEISTDAAPATPHRELLIAGSPGNVQAMSSSRGLAPFQCTGVENSLIYVFGNVAPTDAAGLCVIAAAQIGHTFGLDDSVDCHDVMSFEPLCATPSFTDEAYPCGEDTARACLCGGSTQNSYQLMSMRAGVHP